MGNNKTKAELRIEQFKEKYARMSREERWEESKKIARMRRQLLEDKSHNDEEWDYLSKSPRERRMSNKAWFGSMGASALVGTIGIGVAYGLSTQDWDSAANIAMTGMIPGLACGALITSMYEKKTISNLVTNIRLHLTEKNSIKLENALREESDKVYAIAEVTYDEMGQYKTKEEMGE